MRWTDKALFLGFGKGPERLFQVFDVILLPSVFEGLPFAVIEAQRSGLPFVVSDAVAANEKNERFYARFLAFLEE